MGEEGEEGEARPTLLDRYVSIYVKWPCSCCLCCGMFIFLLGSASIGAGLMNVETREMVWSVWSSPYTQWGMAIAQAKELANDDDRRRLAATAQRRQEARCLAAARPGRALPGCPGAVPWPLPPASLREEDIDRSRRLQTSEDEFEAYLSVYYKTDVAGTGTMFTPERLQAMCKLEATLVNTEVEGTEFMMLDSPTLGFYAPGMHFSNYSWDCPLLPEQSIAQTWSVIMASLNADGALSPYSKYVHPDTVRTGESATTMARALWISPSELEAQEMMVPFDEALGLAPAWFASGFVRAPAYMGDGQGDQFSQHGPFRVRTFSGAHANTEVFDVLPFDFLFALGSVILVWCIMCFHLRSTFMGSFGMFQIIFSLPISCIIYKAVGINYFEFLHVLVVYLVLGIGADDVFVLVDTFRHFCTDMIPVDEEGAYPDKALHQILKGTLSRTGGAIFNTSFTTAVAFAACSVSKVMPMRTCGYFAALCIIFNYIFTMTFFPAILVIWHRHLQSKRCCCPCCGRRQEAKLAGPRMSGLPPPPDKGSIVEVILINYYIPMMRKEVTLPWRGKKVRGCALAIALIMIGVAIQGAYFALQLTPPSKPEAWLPARHMWTGLGNFQSQNYFQPDFGSYSILEFFWGIDYLDMDGLDIYIPANGGAKVVWDSNFDLSQPAAQESLLDFCSQMQTAKCEVDACLEGFSSGTLMMLDTKKTHSCFLEDFKEWNNGTLPTGAAFNSKLQVFRNTAIPADYSSDIIKDYVNYKEDIGFVDGKLRFVIVKIRSTIRGETPYTSGVAARQVVADFVEEQKGKSPSTLNRSLKFMDTWLIFSNFALSAELIAGFFSGCAIALPVAFLVLLLSTRNIVVAVIAVLSVGSIVLCVLGFCKSAMDWDLGIGEAIAGVIVIGYSVDYVVHLAHTYMEAKQHACDTRDERCAFAIQNMGSTVFMGAITTAGAGAIMFFCFLYFFFKMAMLICITIMYSFLFSLGFFMSVMWLIGPEKTFGDFSLPAWPQATKKEEPTT